MECAVKLRTLAWISDVFSRVDSGLLHDHAGDDSSRVWNGATIDSRGDCAGRVFFALPGENVDGHKFARDAVNRGCVAAVIQDAALSEEFQSDNISHYLVEDVLASLQFLARAYRRQLAARVVAITGSGGKTTTKEYIGEILGERFRVHATHGNYNNTIGVPLTILGADEDSEYLVCEVGANQAGEVGFLRGIVDPHVALITNVGDAHIGYFGSRDNIAAAKSELITGLSDDAVAVLPRDDDYFDYLRQQTDARVRSFGVDPAADYVLSEIQVTSSGIEFDVGGEAITLGAFGEYNAMNACAAYAVGDICGVDGSAIRRALGRVAAMRGRGAILRVSGALLIDESYNASPASMVASLSALAGLEGRRRIAILGDMAELGDFAREKHAAIGRHIASLPIDEVYWVGVNGLWVGEAMREHGATANLEKFESVGVIDEDRFSRIGDGDVILVKASRACGLDVFVEKVIANASK